MFRGIWLPMGLMGFALGGCFDIKAATTAQIGCSRDEITISEDRNNMGSRTWIAECGEKRYLCADVATGKFSGQINCTEQWDTKKGDAELSTGAQPMAAVTEAAKDAPKGAAGFLFGATSDEAANVCTASGHEWNAGATADHYTCSGTPSSIGFPATVTVRFCTDKLCAVALQVDAAQQWMSAYAKLSDALTQKYGSPANTVGTLGSNCKTEPDFESCVMSGGMSLQRTWKWDAWSHLSIALTAGAQSPRLDLLYVHRSDAPVAL